MFRQHLAKIALLFVLAAFCLAACRKQSVETETAVEVTSPVETVSAGAAAPTRVVAVTPTVRPGVTGTTAVSVEAAARTPTAEKNLVVCMVQEPKTLYTYGSSMLAQTAVTHGLYEDLYTTLSYNYQASGLEKLPSLEDGDAVVNQVQVSAGDTIADATGAVVTLAAGVKVKNAAGVEVVYDGSSTLTLPQMVVNFTLKPWVWEDGTPVTADDSVYSFEVASDPDTPSSKFITARTAHYEATGNLSLRWTGIPGWLDSTYFANVWQPLPRHAWSTFTAAELLITEESNRMPLANGPFRMKEWIAGDHITLVKNENYYRDGLPYLDTVTFKFFPDTNQILSQLLSGQCDIATQGGLDASQEPLLTDMQSGGLITAYFQTGTAYEYIAFGIDPVAAYAATRPDWFQDVRVRQAMTICTDRQSMVDNLLFGRSEVSHTYLPRSHPLYADGLTQWPYDVERANALLDDVDFLDTNGDGIREYNGAGVGQGRPFTVNLTAISGDTLRQQITQLFKENMLQCGIDVVLNYLPASVSLADGPEGPLFGRKFDLALLSTYTSVEPGCKRYLTSEITGSPANGFGGWGAANVTGWSSPNYDTTCQSALNSLPGTPAYESAHKEAQRIFSREIPVIPLFLHLKLAASLPGVVNFSLDPTQNSELWNLEEIDIVR